MYIEEITQFKIFNWVLSEGIIINPFIEKFIYVDSFNYWENPFIKYKASVIKKFNLFRLQNIYFITNNCKQKKISNEFKLINYEWFK